MRLLKLLSFAGLGTWAFCQVPDVFRDPEKACGLLESEGFLRRDFVIRPYGYECSALPGDRASRAAKKRNPPPDSPVASFAEGSITYLVSGENPSRVSRIKLVVHFAPAGDNKALAAEFERLSTLILRRLGLQVPKELPAALKSTRYYRHQQRGGTISYDPGRRPYGHRVLAVRNPSIRVVAIPRAPGP